MIFIKKQIFVSVFFTGLVTMLFTSIIIIFVFYGFFVKQAKAEVKTGCEIIKSSIDLISDNESYLDSVKQASKYIRLTLVNPSGKVIFDSQSTPSQMANHGDREEIIEAQRDNYGEALRQSQTIGKYTYYYAFIISDGYVLRGARDINSITSVFVNVIPIILGIAIVLIFISILASSYLTKRLIKPVELMKNNLDEVDLNVNIEDSYEELTPFFNKLQAQQLKIKQQIINLEHERDTINAITDNMQEGLIIIDHRKKILSSNKSAVSLLNGSNAFSYVGKPIISLISDNELISNVNDALSNGNSIDTVLSREKQQCRIFINPVYKQEIITGAIIVILDITNIFKAEQIRREFSSNVSHELKTPLTSISGFAEMIETGIAKDSLDIVKFAGKIQKEASRLIALIEDIIHLTEIEDNTPYDIEEVELLQICTETIESLEPSAEKKGVLLSLHGDKSVIKVNRNMISQLLHNLIDNAIKYNKDNGKVDVEVKQTSDTVSLIVKDTGIGMKKEYLDRIFERFYRIDKSRSKQSGGTGLGLSIVKHIVNYHNAVIGVESEFGKGTKITVVFKK